MSNSQDIIIQTSNDCDTSEPIDLLGRQDIVDQIMQLLNAISENKSSCTFALNGKWGSGKTFVMDMLYRELNQFKDGEQYIVLNYNCWKYDYYEEPIIAIVSAIKATVDDENSLLSPEARKKLRIAFDTLKIFIYDNVNFTPLNFVKKIIDAKNTAKENFDEENSFDTYYQFNKKLVEARKALYELTKDYTLVVIVDELDRCLPTYAIKVLERLHHLFDELPNSAVILSVDKDQLSHTVKNVFGMNNTGDKSNITENYLKKFIDFELELGIGKINNNFEEKYADYFNLFDNHLISEPFNFNEYFAALFDGIDIRTQEHMINRLKTIHHILFPDENIRKDYSFMCFELMMIVLLSKFNKLKNVYFVFNHNSVIIQNSNMDEFNKYTTNKWDLSKILNYLQSNVNSNIYTFQNFVNIPEILLWYFQELNHNSNIRYNLPNNISQEFYENAKELKLFHDLLLIIK